MSIESMIVSDHLNKIRAGRRVKLALPSEKFRERNSIERVARFTAIALICMGFGLIKIAELTGENNDRKNG